MAQEEVNELRRRVKAAEQTASLARSDVAKQSEAARKAKAEWVEREAELCSQLAAALEASKRAAAGHNGGALIISPLVPG